MSWSQVKEVKSSWSGGQLENKWNCTEKAAKISFGLYVKRTEQSFLVERKKVRTLKKKRASRKDYVKFRKFSSISTPERNEL